jgi:hypothetical protein
MTPRRRHLALSGVLVPALLGLGAASGCYEHVVSATGPGADRVNVVKPNVEKPADKEIAGPRSIQLKQLRQRD